MTEINQAMTFAEVKKGSTVVVMYSGSGRLCDARRVVTAEVTAAGHKYITVGRHGKFQAGNGYGDFGHRIFPSLAYFERAREEEILRSAMADAFSFGRRTGTLEQLRQVAEILGIDAEQRLTNNKA